MNYDVLILGIPGALLSFWRNPGRTGKPSGIQLRAYLGLKEGKIAHFLVWSGDQTGTGEVVPRYRYAA